MKLWYGWLIRAINLVIIYGLLQLSFSQFVIPKCYNSNSNSNWTFIALNLPKQEDSKAQQTKSSQQNSVSRDITGVEHHGERREDDSG